MLRVAIKQVVLDVLSTRVLPDGGLADRPGGQFRVDATAWGGLLLYAAGGAQETLDRLRSRLAHEQGQDGRVWVRRDHPDSFWPTAPAILVWQDSPANQAAQQRAIHFLLETSGNHYRRRPEDPPAHDTLLKGWPWIGGTHSWIEPTALAVIALKATGHSQHDRVREAIRMILDRQLPHGGWNYGNTLVFGQELHPMPESTGAALAGLAGMVGRDKVIRSLDYLQDEVDRLRTPISLGWNLIGLAAWDLWPSNGAVLVERCLANQSRYGDYDTSALWLLLLGALAGETDTKTNLLIQTSRTQSTAVLIQ